MTMYEDHAPETLLDPRKTMPSVTAVLGGEGVVDQVRGIAGRAIRPVSSAVVIGLGGTGVQTAARIKAAVRANRIDQEAHDKVAFLAIDAVGEQKMNPPLPEGVTLGSDLMNLMGFNAGAYLAGALPNESYLRKWWDYDYRVPTGELNDGLKRERMLGRLCFHQEVSRIEAAIRNRVGIALGMDPKLLGGGHGGVQGAEVAIYLIASSVGGTGSSAFLEVLAAVHRVALDLGIKAKIRAFVLLPGAFSTTFSNQQSAATIGAAQRANAYGFFKELDHFIAHDGEFLEVMGHGSDKKVSNGNLVHSVYVFDSNVGSRGLLNSITDIYEIIAESIYQFLFSTVGMAILGTDGVNIERILQEEDKFHKPRRYCSLGLSRILVPGDTYRFHLIMWWCDWFLRAGFLRELTADELVELKDSDKVAELSESLATLVQQSGEGHFDDIVKTFIDIGRDAPAALEANPDPANAEDTMTTLDDQVASVEMEIRQVLEVLRPRLLDRLAETVERGVFSESASVPRAREIVRVLLKRLQAQLADAESTANAQALAKSRADEVMEDRLDDLVEADARNILEAALAHVVGVVNDEVMTASETGERLGNAIKDWTRAVVGGQYAEARRDYLKAACKRLESLRDELEEANRSMRSMADTAKDLWESDVLIGKDAGPEATSVLIPNDTLPEIELSTLSRSLRLTIGEEYRHLLRDESLTEFHSRLISGSLTRGFFDMGNRDPLRRKRAKDALLHQLEEDAFELALKTVDQDGNPRPRLPRDLMDAATQLGEQALLGAAMRGLQELSQEVCWSWEPGRLQLMGDDDQRAQDRPRVTSAVIAHESMRELVRAEFSDPEVEAEAPDPERVLALSCEWAVPIHCLPAVDRWRADYLRLAAKRESERAERPEAGVEPPNHIDRRFEEFKDLVPDYFAPEEAAPRFAKGLVLAATLRSESSAEAVVELYYQDATRLPVSPIRQERGIGFVGRRVTVEGGRLRPSSKDNDVVLGRSWFVALRGVGLDVGLATSIDECWDVLVLALEPATLTEIIEQELMVKLARARRRRNLDARDAEALGHLENALTDLNNELAVSV